MGSRIAIYARISDDREGTQTATPRQLADARAFAALRGWEVAEELEDVDLSAYRRVERPGFERAVELVSSGAVDGVLVWKLDRLVRRAAEFERFWAACEGSGAFLASVNEPIDTTTELGMVIVRILVAFAQLESANISMRVRSSIAAGARAGRPWKGGRRAYGLTDSWLDVVEDEVEVIREAASRILAGDSLRGVCIDFNERGIPSPAGGTWKPTSLRTLLSAMRLAGIREHRGAIVAEGTWPAILDRTTVETLRALFNDRPRREVVTPRSYLLSPILRCRHCGGRMRGSRANTGQPRYICPAKPEGCGRTAALAEPVDEHLERMLFAAIDDRSLAAAVAELRSGQDLSSTSAELADIQAELEQLARDHYADKVIGRGQFLAASQALESRHEALRRRLLRERQAAVLVPFLEQPGALRRAWASMGLARKRAVLAALVERVTLEPVVKGRNRFDPGRVTVTWRA